LHPFQRKTDVEKPGVQHTMLGNVIGREESKGTQTILNRDNDDAIAGGLANV
jgi:hypothetical protein